MLKESDIFRAKWCEGDATVGKPGGIKKSKVKRGHFPLFAKLNYNVFKLTQGLSSLFSSFVEKKNVLPQLLTISLMDCGSHFVSHSSIKYKEPQVVFWCEHDLLLVIRTFVIPRAPIHTSR